jgi:hypothetical protein
VPGSHQPLPDRWDYGWHVHVGAGDLVAGSLPSLETSSSNFGLSAISFLMAYLFVLGSPIDRENFLGITLLSKRYFGKTNTPIRSVSILEDFG